MCVFLSPPTSKVEENYQKTTGRNLRTMGETRGQEKGEALFMSEVKDKKLLIKHLGRERKRQKKKRCLGKEQGGDLRVKGHNIVEMNSQWASFEGKNPSFYSRICV